MGIMNNKTKIINKNFINEGDYIGIIGKSLWGTDNGLSGSEFQSFFDKTISGEINIDLDFEEKIQKNIRILIKNNLINSATDISLGGLIMSLIKSCEKNNLGVNINKSIPENWAGALFGEDLSLIHI